MNLALKEWAVADAAARRPAISILGVSRSFGAVRALSDATLSISYGEKLGIVGHNGAGKSTLMNVLSGVHRPDSGEITLDGQSYSGLSPRQVHELGIRCIFQELSLCPNLTSIENTLIRHTEVAGWGWQKRARALIEKSLQRIFPGQNIDIHRPLGELTIAQRQMVEIAEAFAGSASKCRLVILDEPTSSLDAKAADQLMTFIDIASREGTATILISHRLHEILRHTDRIIAMVDGRIIADASSKEFSRQSLVAVMGHLDTEPVHAASKPRANSATDLVLKARDDDDGALGLEVHKGEIVGFAGLDGHGQRHTLQQIFDAASKGQAGLNRGSAAYVAGDRQTEGVFPVWSVSENLTVRALRDISVWGLIDVGREHQMVVDWFKRIGVRTGGPNAAIGTLSGGNQQKILFARALASKASLILLDDPMRGVDVGTKSEVYALIHREAAEGRSFIWYSTETEELNNCDRVYIFREGEIVAVLEANEVNEENILRASFADRAVVGSSQ
ncbi:sugar ABC transporter ATP-binding protein [Ensifer sp. YR511]|uniref:sugar ABC transporter ATP-binding protein n=1 Tax=Ensifer sp. YR511 TaxID=1855294 RepID=UPI000888603E|nr:sugar ABC transporter ATP-binding protein [Ensifer sp. YR511]SDO07506.1 ribose transport system ATP-binding protein [Ensifer sp. YR511]